MKTKQHKKEFKTVDYFHRVKEKISEELKDLTFEQQKEYFSKARSGKIKLKESK